MTTLRPRPYSLLTVLRPALGTVLLAAAALPAQATCYDFGSQPVAAQWLPAPVTLGCQQAPSWPQWRLFLPPHRAPGAHLGYNPGDAHRLPSVIVLYRCTGYWLVPVVPHRLRLMGYVIDQPEYACSSPDW